MRRIFCDRYSSPRRAETALFFGDAVSILSAILFATGAPYFGRGPVDAILLALWALIPRSTAHFLERLGMPRGFALGFLVSFCFLLASVTLILAGWDLYRQSLPIEMPLRTVTGAVVVVTWCWGFFLHRPRTYRAHDFLLGLTVLLGLLQSMPHGLLWTGLYFAGTGISLVFRRLLFDVFPGTRRPPLNLHDARSLAAILTLAAFAVAAGAWLALEVFLGPRTPHRVGFDLSEYSWNDLALGSDLVVANQADSRGEFPAREVKSTVGFSAEVKLQDLALPRFDERVVFTATPMPGSRYRSDPFTLWRVLSLAEYSPENGSWRDDVELLEREWPEAQRVEARPSEREPVPQDALDGVRIEVVTPILVHMVSPYFGQSFEDVTIPVDVSGTRSRPVGYGRSGSDELVIRPSLLAGSSYVSRFERVGGGRVLPPPTRSFAVDPHSDGRYLRVPGNASLAVDLGEYALAHVGNHGPVQARVETLLRHLNDEFVRSDRYAWSSAGDPLGVFLGRERRGDCTYFATASALLLRAVGVPTRLVVGFRGGERAEDGSIHVRNRTAHAWIEVWHDEFGWFPVDPAAWVERIDPNDPQMTATEPVEPEFAELEPHDQGKLDDDAVGEGEDPDLRDGQETPEEIEKDRLAAGDSVRAPESDELQDLAAGESSRGRIDESWISFLPKALDPFSPRVRSNEAAELSETPEPFDLRARSMRVVLAALLVVAIVILIDAIRRSRQKTEEKREEEEEELSAEELALLADRSFADLGPRPEDPAAALVWEYASLQQDLRLVRRHRLAHETPLEHGRRYHGHDEQLDGALAHVHRWLYTVLYGRHSIDTRDLDSVRESALRVRRLLR